MELNETSIRVYFTKYFTLQILGLPLYYLLISLSIRSEYKTTLMDGIFLMLSEIFCPQQVKSMEPRRLY